MSVWKDIDNAPKDGSRILATDSNRVLIIQWANVNEFAVWLPSMQWCVAEAGTDSMHYQRETFNPNGWMPLPEA